MYQEFLNKMRDRRVTSGKAATRIRAVAHVRVENAASSLTPPRPWGHALFVPTSVEGCRQGLQTQVTSLALGRRKNRYGILISYF